MNRSGVYSDRPISSDFLKIFTRKIVDAGTPTQNEENIGGTFLLP